jgi:hypothetical protein
VKDRDALEFQRALLPCILQSSAGRQREDRVEEQDKALEEDSSLLDI